MLFNSIHFLIFAPIVVTIYYGLPHRGQRVLLLLASLYFYAVFKIPFTILLLASVAFSYIAGRGMTAAGDTNPGLRKFWLYFAITGNLSILFFFKYVDFAIRVINQSLGLVALDYVHVEQWGVILPMGISFFTLQSIAYAVDVYRGQIPATKSPYQFTLFISFFPQLVAGPIMRARELLDQFSERHPFRRENLEIGLYLVALGLFKKTLIADELTIAADQVYADPMAYSGLGNFVASLLFSIQIYCDFSGYSDVAIGMARILGFRFPMNFDRPFMSTTVTEMWRRWHISLSGWLRDYIYITLGGNRVGIARQYVNIILTMFIGGLWHGADWTYIIWGLLHAGAMVVERVVLGFEGPRRVWEAIPRFIRMFYPYVWFAVAMLFFRAYPTQGMSGIEVALTMVGRVLTFAPGDFPTVPLAPLALAVLMFSAEYLIEIRPKVMEFVDRRPFVMYAATGLVLGLCFFIYSVTASPQFIYFQF